MCAREQTVTSTEAEALYHQDSKEVLSKKNHQESFKYFL